ncbi:hypothetical protein E2C01_100012 [Portunus trituberculatus]|uniref:Uncharacterized protein n=1 Tax=Portunus trituberculatus TaxID=210409 RepID=A0A5B7K1V5_PORTR|nr:hypothetical protein [Portunus trituberculatus]
MDAQPLIRPGRQVEEGYDLRYSLGCDTLSLLIAKTPFTVIKIGPSRPTKPPQDRGYTLLLIATHYCQHISSSLPLVSPSKAVEVAGESCVRFPSRVTSNILVRVMARQQNPVTQSPTHSYIMKFDSIGNLNAGR